MGGIGREWVEGVHGGELSGVNGSGHGEEGRGSGHENSKAWKERVGGREVRSGFRGWVVRVEDVADVVGRGKLTGLADDERVGLVGGWFREEGEGWKADAKGVILADGHEVGSIVGRRSKVMGELLEEGGFSGKVGGAGQEADPSVGCYCVTKVRAADDACLVGPVGGTVGGEGGGEGAGGLSGSNKECTL